MEFCIHTLFQVAGHKDIKTPAVHQHHREAELSQDRILSRYIKKHIITHGQWHVTFSQVVEKRGRTRAWEDQEGSPRGRTNGVDTYVYRNWDGRRHETIRPRARGAERRLRIPGLKGL